MAPLRPLLKLLQRRAIEALSPSPSCTRLDWASVLLLLLALTALAGCWVAGIDARIALRVATGFSCATATDNLAGGDFSPRLCHDSIDIVYTWVNGSDLAWRAEMLATRARWDADEGMLLSASPSPRAAEASDASVVNGTDAADGDVAASNRYRDNDELRYSLRSLFKYAPWVRRVHIVTNGQVPSWLNTEHPRINVVSHADIFPDPAAHLPTFSSPAIETHITRIVGLSRRFIYFNDDVMLGAPTWPDDFFTHAQGQKFYGAWDVPKCNAGCVDSWISDGFCDTACNVSSCLWDGGDCFNNSKTRSGSGGSTHSYKGKYDHSSSAYSTSSSSNADSSGGGSSAEATTVTATPAEPGAPLWDAPCALECPDAWLGDRVCDAACYTIECGWDAGDCGGEEGGEEGKRGAASNAAVGSVAFAPGASRTIEDTHAAAAREALHSLHVAWSARSAPCPVLPRLQGFGDAAATVAPVPEPPVAPSCGVTTLPLIEVVAALISRATLPSSTFLAQAVLPDGESAISSLRVATPMTTADAHSAAAAAAAAAVLAEADAVANLTAAVNASNATRGRDSSPEIVFAGAAVPPPPPPFQVHAAVLDLSGTLAVANSVAARAAHVRAGVMLCITKHVFSVMTDATTACVNATACSVSAPVPVAAAVAALSCAEAEALSTVAGTNASPPPILNRIVQLVGAEHSPLSALRIAVLPLAHTTLLLLPRREAVLAARDGAFSRLLEQLRTNATDTNSSSSSSVVAVSNSSSGSGTGGTAATALTEWGGEVDAARQAAGAAGLTMINVSRVNPVGGVLLDLGNLSLWLSVLEAAVEMPPPIAALAAASVTSSTSDAVTLTAALAPWSGEIAFNVSFSALVPLWEEGEEEALPTSRGGAQGEEGEALVSVPPLHLPSPASPSTKEVPAVPTLAASPPPPAPAVVQAPPPPAPSVAPPLPAVPAAAPPPPAAISVAAPPPPPPPAAAAPAVAPSVSAPAPPAARAPRVAPSKSMPPPIVEVPSVSAAPPPPAAETTPPSVALGVPHVPPTPPRVETVGSAPDNAAPVAAPVVETDRAAPPASATLPSRPPSGRQQSGRNRGRKLLSVVEDAPRVLHAVERQDKSQLMSLQEGEDDVETSIVGLAHVDAWSDLSIIVKGTAPMDKPPRMRRLNAPHAATTPPADGVLFGELVHHAWSQVVELSSTQGKPVDPAPIPPLDFVAGAVGSEKTLMQPARGRRLADTYAESLVFSNRLISASFGKRSRKVPAHMPHMIDTRAMNLLQARYPAEYAATAARRFRHGTDVQYAFAYLHFLLEGGAREGLDVAHYFMTELDADGDGVLSENEMRTLASIVHRRTPSGSEIAELRECLVGAPSAEHVTISRKSLPGGTEEELSETRVLRVKRITWNALMACPTVTDALTKHARFGPLAQDMGSLANEEVAFEMVGDDYNKTIAALDSIRGRRPKFICINDNMNSPGPEVLAALRSFYESFSAWPSPFELPRGVVNAELYIGPLRAHLRWQAVRKWCTALLITALLITVIVQVAAAWAAASEDGGAGGRGDVSTPRGGGGGGGTGLGGAAADTPRRVRGSSRKRT